MKKLCPAHIRVCVSILFIVFLAACATPASEEKGDEAAGLENINDPFESTNRAIFSFNQFVNGILFKPLTLLYRFLVPDEPRRSIHNALVNLRAPVDAANNLFQGDVDGATVTAERFAINSTIGVGGLFDFATDFGIEEGQREDFGQTLAVWDVGEGPYLVLPLFGPSNPRDAIGILAVDTFLDPAVYFAGTPALGARTGVVLVDELEPVIDTLDEIERTSIDFYATMRSLYRQHRADQIRDGKPAPIVPIPSISIYDFEDLDENRVTQAD